MLAVATLRAEASALIVVSLFTTLLTVEEPVAVVPLRPSLGWSGAAIGGGSGLDTGHSLPAPFALLVEESDELDKQHKDDAPHNHPEDVHDRILDSGV